VEWGIDQRGAFVVTCFVRRGDIMSKKVLFLIECDESVKDTEWDRKKLEEFGYDVIAQVGPDEVASTIDDFDAIIIPLWMMVGEFLSRVPTQYGMRAGLALLHYIRNNPASSSKPCIIYTAGFTSDEKADCLEQTKHDPYTALVDSLKAPIGETCFLHILEKLNV